MALHGLTSITFWVPGAGQVELVSPKHVPDDVVAAPAIPYARTGKKPEIPVKRILQGAALACVAGPGPWTASPHLPGSPSSGTRRSAREDA